MSIRHQTLHKGSMHQVHDLCGVSYSVSIVRSCVLYAILCVLLDAVKPLKAKLSIIHYAEKHDLNG